jgi:myo-inositol 2-dehydrogenase / D-chiro-inositol 1-dehydrogenase
MTDHAAPRPLGLLVLSGVRHAASYLPIFAARDDVRLLGICEEEDAPAWMQDDGRRLADRFDLPYERGLARLDDPAVDLVLVCSEPVRHARLAERALAAGKHVLVDKPMATSLTDADRLVEAARRGTGRLAVMHRLFSPAIQRARAAIAAGQLGLVRSIDVEFLASDGLTGQAVERPELVADPALSGGGELVNFLVYPVGYLRYLTGAEIVEVYAEVGSFFFEPHRRHGVEDLAILSLLLEHGIVATVTVGRVPQAPSGGGIGSTIRLIGSHGHMTVDENQPSLEVWGRTASERRQRPIGGDPGAIAVATAIGEFLCDVREGRPPLAGAEDGRAAVAVIEAAYRSAATGQPQRVL